jgi:hypothetical protein
VWQSEGPEPSRLKAPAHDRSRCAEHGGVAGTDWHGVRVPPGVVMVSPPATTRNASKAQSKGRTKEAPQRGQEHYKGRSPVGHRPKGGWVGLFHSPSSSSKRLESSWWRPRSPGHQDRDLEAFAHRLDASSRNQADPRRCSVVRPPRRAHARQTSSKVSALVHSSKASSRIWSRTAQRR